MGERINQGYTIISSLFVEKTEFVIGENLNAPNPYVTWKCKNGTDYYWGHYKSTLNSAKKDFYSRIKNEIKYLISSGTIPPINITPPISNSMAEIKTMENYLGDFSKSIQKFEDVKQEIIKKKRHNEPER